MSSSPRFDFFSKSFAQGRRTGACQVHEENKMTDFGRGQTEIFTHRLSLLQREIFRAGENLTQRRLVYPRMLCNPRELSAGFFRHFRNPVAEEITIIQVLKHAWNIGLSGHVDMLAI